MVLWSFYLMQIIVIDIYCSSVVVGDLITENFWKLLLANIFIFDSLDYWVKFENWIFES